MYLYAFPFQISVSQERRSHLGHNELSPAPSIADTAKKKSDNLIKRDIDHLQSITNDISTKSFRAFIPNSGRKIPRHARGVAHSVVKAKQAEISQGENDNIKLSNKISQNREDEKLPVDNTKPSKSNTAEEEIKNKMNVKKLASNRDTLENAAQNTDKSITGELEAVKKPEITNASFAVESNNTTPRCPSQTDPTDLPIVTEFR